MPHFDFQESYSCIVAGKAIYEAALKSDKVWGITTDLGFTLKKLKELYPEHCVDSVESGRQQAISSRENTLSHHSGTGADTQRNLLSEPSGHHPGFW